MGQHQRLIIDGYNVIYTDDRFRRIACKNLEGARAKFIALLGSYLAHRSIHVTLVFDGKAGITESEAVVPGKLQVVFSDGGRSADELIVRTVRESGNPKQYIVITSDQADIGSRLRPLGCRVIGSKQFLDRIKRSLAGDNSAPDEEELPAPDMGDTDYWLDQFEANGEGKQ